VEFVGVVPAGGVVVIVPLEVVPFVVVVLVGGTVVVVLGVV
jgi:hypothetical protein